MRTEDDRDSERFEPDDRIRAVLEYAAAILIAIDFGELFAAAPVSAEDRKRHETGVYLLEALRELLQSKIEETRADADSVGENTDLGGPVRSADVLRRRRP